MAATKRAVVGKAEGSGNNFAVKDVKPFEYKGDDAMTTKTYHGVSIVAGLSGSTIIGRVQSWQPDAYTREGVHLYELADRSWGRPVEYIPGKSTGFTIAVTRAEVWDGEMEKAFGFKTAFNDLIDQNRPFTIREFWLKGSTTYHIWTYRGCWFTSKNYDALTSDGDGITKISGTIAYTSHFKSSGSGS
jgi:hypothetical protein